MFESYNEYYFDFYNTTSMECIERDGIFNVHDKSNWHGNTGTGSV